MATRILASFSLNLASHQNCLGPLENVFSRPQTGSTLIIHRPFRRSYKAPIALKCTSRPLEAQSADQPTRLATDIAHAFEPVRRRSWDSGCKIFFKMPLKPHTLWATFHTSLTAYAPRRPQKPGTRALNGRAQSRVRPSMPLQLLDKMPLSNRLRKRPPTQPRAQKCHRTKPAKIPFASVAAADLLIGVACALGPTKAAIAESRPPARFDVPVECSEIRPANTSQEEQLLGGAFELPSREIRPREAVELAKALPIMCNFYIEKLRKEAGSLSREAP